jgi:hypothetical protein
MEREGRKGRKERWRGKEEGGKGEASKPKKGKVVQVFCFFFIFC